MSRLAELMIPLDYANLKDVLDDHPSYPWLLANLEELLEAEYIQVSEQAYAEGYDEGYKDGVVDTEMEKDLEIEQSYTEGWKDGFDEGKEMGIEIGISATKEMRND